MPRRRDLPCDELRASYLAGQSTSALARRYGCSPTTISKHLRDCGVALRPARFTPITFDADALRRAYLEERLPIAAIAARFGVSASTVGNKRRRLGIPPRPRRVAASALSDSSQE
jgi:transposase-like protein